MLTADRGWSWVWGYGLITPIEDLQAEAATLGVQNTHGVQEWGTGEGYTPTEQHAFDLLQSPLVPTGSQNILIVGHRASTKTLNSLHCFLN